MKTVAQGDGQARAQTADQQRQLVQRGAAVPGRNEAAGPGGGAAFFKMQIGDNDDPLGRPEQRAGGVKVEHVVVQVQRGRGALAGSMRTEQIRIKLVGRL